MAEYAGMSVHRIESVFERYQKLDSEELAAAAGTVHSRADAVAAAYQRGGWKKDPKREPPTEAEYDRTMVDSAAVAWAEALKRAAGAGKSDIVGYALKRALKGDRKGLEKAVRDIQKITFAELEKQIAGLAPLKADLARAGMATFLLAEGAGNTLAQAQGRVSAAVGAVETALRADLARRLSAIAVEEESRGERSRKSMGNRARRAKEWEAALPSAQEAYRLAAAELQKNAWAQGKGKASPVEAVPKGERQRDRAAERAELESILAEAPEQAEAGADRDAPGKNAEAQAPARAGKEAAAAMAEEKPSVDEAAPNADGKDAPSAAKQEHVYVRVPSDWVHPFMGKPDAQGRRQERCYIVLGEACSADDVDLGGYKFFRNLQDFHKQAIAEGKSATFRFESDSTVSLVKDGAPTIETSPWTLTRAVKEGRAAAAGGAAEQAKKRSQQAERGYVRITFPPKWAHTYKTKPNAEGKVFDKAVVNIPSGTVLSGQSLDGYSADVFLQDFHKQAIAEGRPVTFSFPDDKPVRLFAEGKPDLQADPWTLSTAVKAGREAFNASRNRMVAKTPDRAVKNAGSVRQGHDGAVKVPAAAK